MNLEFSKTNSLKINIMKTQEDDLLIYDDEDAVKFIMKLIPSELKERINENVVNYILDVLYDYYEENGLISEDSAEEASIDEEDMLNYVVEAAAEDGIKLNEDEIQLILDGEYEYGKSLGIYSEDEE